MITVLQWNCRSLIPKLDSFKYLINSFNCDAFALNETWLDLNDDLNFNNFNIIRLDRTGRGGGVLVGIKKCHTFYRIHHTPVTGIEIVSCQAKIKGTDLSISSVYIPPNTKVSRHQLEDITSCLPEPRLILGDFNSHGTGWGSSYDDNRSKMIYDLCDNFSMTILNTGEVTRISGPHTQESRLDLSLASSMLSLDCTWKVIQDPYGSDHLPIIVSISTGTSGPEPGDIPYDLTRNIDWQKYADEIDIAIDAVQELPPEEENRYIVGLIIKCAIAAQTKRFTGSTVRQRPPTPWWDKECSTANEEKSKAFVEFRRSGLVERYRRYLALERKYKNLVRAKKRGYWRHFVDGLSRETSMSTLWKTARNLRNRVSTNESEESSDRWLFDFAKKVCPDSVPSNRVIHDTSRYGYGLDSPFSMVELSLALLSCNNSAPGMDSIKFNLLKNLPVSAKRRLLNLFNKCVELNTVPREWKQVKVIAIRKPGKPTSDYNSYRPIAMLSCIRKLLEKIILGRLDLWVESNNLLSSTQFGFRRGKGTNDCLALLSSEIQLAFAKKLEMPSVFLDIKGAFDSVSIDILVEKLRTNGLSSVLSNFLHNLLSEKSMYFTCGTTSTSRLSYMGLPQGSCLSPLLYNFYVNKIDECLVNNCTLRQLADDCVVSFIPDKGGNDLRKPLQDTLDNLSLWAAELGIDFSPEKTELVVFSRKHSPTQLQLQLSGKTITQSLSFKYLGVWFDSKCYWGKHTRYLKQKCQQRINFLRTVTGTWWGAHPEDLIRLYQTTILSLMEYGSFCFTSAADVHMIKLERIQYRCLRIAMGCMQSTHTMSLEVLAGVLPLKNRFRELSLRFLIRCETMNPLVIENFERLLELNPQVRFMTLYHQYITLDVRPSTFTTDTSSHSVSYSRSLTIDLSMKDAIRGIPDHVRPIAVPPIFASKIRHIDPSKIFYTDGSRIDNLTGFGVFNENYQLSYKLQEPCSVYVAELAAIHRSLVVISTLPADHYFIYSDSLSSIEAIRSMKLVKRSSFFLQKISEILSAIVENSFRITLAWVPSHCSIPGNEKADALAKVGTMGDDIYERIISYHEFLQIPRHEALSDWQSKWDKGDLGRWLHTIIPKVSTKPWFKRLNMSRDFIRVVSRLMSNHYRLDAHSYRIGLSTTNVCVCGDGYHDIDHVVWACERYSSSRSALLDTLRARGRLPNVPIRDILGNLDFESLYAVYRFLKDSDLVV